MLIATIFLQIYWLNLGLASFESLYNVPTFTATWIVGTALGGGLLIYIWFICFCFNQVFLGVFYGEFAEFTTNQALLFPTGMVICVAGKRRSVSCLSKHNTRRINLL